MARSQGPLNITRTGSGALVSRGGVVTRGYIRGGPELSRALGRLEQGLRDELLAEATQAGGDVLAEEWRSRVPVDDGDYRDSIYARGYAGKIGASGVVATKTVPGLAKSQQPRNYAARLEFTKHPSLRPAYDSAQARMLEAMASVLRRLIEKVV